MEYNPDMAKRVRILRFVIVGISALFFIDGLIPQLRIACRLIAGRHSYGYIISLIASYYVVSLSIAIPAADYVFRKIPALNKTTAIPEFMKTIPFSVLMLSIYGAVLSIPVHELLSILDFDAPAIISGEGVIGVCIVPLLTAVNGIRRKTLVCLDRNNPFNIDIDGINGIGSGLYGFLAIGTAACVILSGIGQDVSAWSLIISMLIIHICVFLTMQIEISRTGI